MKSTIRIAAIVITLMMISTVVQANGVLIVNAKLKVVVPMTASSVNVQVENQVAIVTATQSFKNTSNQDLSVLYAFPMPEGASATRLRWFTNGQWLTASFEINPDSGFTPGPSSDMHPNLLAYLGPTPLSMQFDSLLRKGEVLTVELTYVQLLPYKSGFVNFSYPNNYALIQTGKVDEQTFIFSLTSPRTIESIALTSHTELTHVNDGHVASVTTSQTGAPCGANYAVRYKLSLAELGMFGFSTGADSSSGYFTFIVEPSPETTDIIQKNFCLIIDRSGSMMGTKMQQALDAAKYIVENLNPGDMFNLVEYDNLITPFKPSLVSYTPENKAAALNWLLGISARGSTDIEGALRIAINQFNSVPKNNANLMIFLTDGQPTAGITDVNSILTSIRYQIQYTGKKINLFTFGIGSDADANLLSQLAAQNSGISEMLGTGEVRTRISEFYNTIRNPVLIDPKVEFSSTKVIEVYPQTLPNLYKGQQMIISGKYRVPLPMVTTTFSGTAFGLPVVYTYDMILADTVVPKYSFLPKVWAKQKIEYLLALYYALNPNSQTAKEYKAEIVRISMMYGVISPFTNFSSEPTAVEIPESGPVAAATDYALLGNYPNPFNPGTTIHFRVALNLHRTVLVKIYNAAGVLVRVLGVDVSSAGEYRVYWNGVDSEGRAVPSGAYVYIVDFGDALLSGRMQLLK